ncbi:unnamed protein product [Closterium sp. NIES-53]
MIQALWRLAAPCASMASPSRTSPPSPRGPNFFAGNPLLPRKQEKASVAQLLNPPDSVPATPPLPPLSSRPNSALPGSAPSKSPLGVLAVLDGRVLVAWSQRRLPSAAAAAAAAADDAGSAEGSAEGSAVGSDALLSGWCLAWQPLSSFEGRSGSSSSSGGGNSSGSSRVREKLVYLGERHGAPHFALEVQLDPSASAAAAAHAAAAAGSSAAGASTAANAAASAAAGTGAAGAEVRGGGGGGRGGGDVAGQRLTGSLATPATPPPSPDTPAEPASEPALAAPAEPGAAAVGTARDATSSQAAENEAAQGNGSRGNGNGGSTDGGGGGGREEGGERGAGGGGGRGEKGGGGGREERGGGGVVIVGGYGRAVFVDLRTLMLATHPLDDHARHDLAIAGHVIRVVGGRVTQLRAHLEPRRPSLPRLRRQRAECPPARARCTWRLCAASYGTVIPRADHPRGGVGVGWVGVGGNGCWQCLWICERH